MKYGILTLSVRKHLVIESRETPDGYLLHSIKGTHTKLSSAVDSAFALNRLAGKNPIESDVSSYAVKAGLQATIQRNEVRS